MRFGKLFAVLFIAAFFVSPSVFAAVFDPGAGWKTVESRHFRIHHPADLADNAQKAAHILEGVYPEITEKWSWKPQGYTEVVLVDNTDDANGMSTVIPYNWMLIYVAPPDPDSPLAHYDDWFRVLLVHEFTHIVQIDAIGGIWWPFRFFLGKTVAPSGIDPVWMREGMAQYGETIFTRGGRGRGAYSEMVVRTSILENNFPPIDVADGQGYTWPSYRGAYIYGVKFIQWLIETYGEDKFLQFDKRVRSSILLAMINHQAKNVYGKTFYQLWNEWKCTLEGRYAMERAKVEAGGVTEPVPVIKQSKEDQLDSPTVSRDGKKIAYVETSPFGKAEIRVRDLESGDDKVIKKGQNAVQLSWSPDGKKIVYSAVGTYKRYNRFHDLWVYDFDSEKAKKITNGARARDPDFMPDGRGVVFVASDRGTDRLKLVDIETKKITDLTPNPLLTQQFANARVSPDGKYIAVSVWKSGDGWRIYRYNSDGTNPVRLTKGRGLVIEKRPAWTPDGKYVVYSSDETGIDNLYRASSDGGGSKRITNVLSGAFEPAVLSDSEIIAQYYTSTGFEIVKFNAAPPDGSGKKGGRKAKGAETKDAGKGSPAASEERASSLEMNAPLSFSTDSEPKEYGFKDRKYVAFGRSLFRPRFVTPNIAYTGDTFFFSLTTGGADVLRWHNWLASGTYRSDANYFGYYMQYWYNRFRPMFGAVLTDYAVNFGDITFVSVDSTGAITTRTVHFYEKRRAISSFVSFPIKRHNFLLAYYFEDHMPKTSLTTDEKNALNLGHFAGLRFDYRYGDFESFPASISRENGRSIRLTTSVTDEALGSSQKNEQVIFSGDWREYLKFGLRQVFALRAAGGIQWGDPTVQGVFGLGGALGEGSFGGAGTYNYFPLRGLPVSALSRSRAMLFSGEYRFPIFSPQRGIGTVPVFFKNISGALFADYGNAWNAHEGGSDSIRTFFDNFMLSLGAEIRGDFVIGHGLPVHGRVGWGIVTVNNDRAALFTDPITGASGKYGMLVLALGTSF